MDPESQAQLFARLREKGIPWLEYQEVVSLVATMHHLNAPMIFNHEDWGLAREELREIVLPAPRGAPAGGVSNHWGAADRRKPPDTRRAPTHTSRAASGSAEKYKARRVRSS